MASRRIFLWLSLSVLFLAILGFWFWRMRGRFFDLYWVAEVQTDRRLCTAVLIPNTSPLPEGRWSLKMDAYRSPNPRQFVLATRATGPTDPPATDFLLLDPETRSVSRLRERTIAPPELEQIRALENAFGCQLGYEQFNFDCDGTRYPTTYSRAPYAFRPPSLSRLALHTAEFDAVAGWYGWFNPFNWHSHHGDFAIDFYARNRPERRLTTLRGGWLGHRFQQYQYSADSSYWLSDRFFVTPADLEMHSILLCDFGQTQ